MSALPTRALGRTDLRLSEITLGTWGLAEESYGPVAPATFDAVLHAAIDAGITTFDVAPLWGDGEAERRVGAAIAERGVESTVITRAGVRRVKGVLEGTFDRDALIADCEGSLERLGRDEIDLWLLHNPGDEVLRQDGFRQAVERLEEAGKIRAWGVSVGDAEEARLAIEAGAQAICMTYNLLATHELEDLTAEITRAGCGVLARSPLMFGLLAGQWSEMKQFDDDDHRGRRWGLDAFAQRIRQVEQRRFLVGDGCPDLATAALRFVLAHPLVSTAIVGARTARQARHAAAAAENGAPYLRDDDVARLRKLSA